MKTYLSKNNFAYGQINNSLNGRYDLALNRNGLSVFENFYSSFEGGARFRPGTKKIQNIEESKLIPFIFNNEQSYLMCFSQEKVIFFTYDSENNLIPLQGKGSTLVDLSTATLTANYNQADLPKIYDGDESTYYRTHEDVFFATISYDAYLTANINIVFASPINMSVIEGVINVTEEYKIFATDINDVETLIQSKTNTFYDDALYYEYLPGKIYKSIRLELTGLKQIQSNYCTYYFARLIELNIYITNVVPQVTITTPYSLKESRELKVAQNFDVMYLVHPNHKPKKLTRTAYDAFTLVDVVFTNDPFDADEYPNSVSFYESRLIYGGTNKKPTYLFGSQIGHYDNFDQGTQEDDEAFEFDLAGAIDSINWLFQGSNTLIVGTSRRLLSVNGGSSSTPITPKKVLSRIVSNIGTSNVDPIRRDSLILYVDYTQRNVRAFNYDLISESFNSNSLNLYNSDTTVSGIKEIVFKRDNNDLFYCTKNNGEINATVLNVNEGINGIGIYKTQGEFKSISTIPRTDGFENLAVCVKRKINGVDSFTLEQFSDELEYKNRTDFYTNVEKTDDYNYRLYMREEIKKFNYLDNSIKYQNLYASTITFSGGIITSNSGDFKVEDIDREIIYKNNNDGAIGRFRITGYIDAYQVNATNLITDMSSPTSSSWYKTFNEIAITEPSEFGVVGDGTYLGKFTPSSNKIELGREITTAYVGLLYIGKMQSNNLGIDVQGISTQITKKNIFGALLRFSYSAGGRFGTTFYNTIELEYFKTSGHYDEPTLLTNGDIIRRFNDRWKQDKRFCILQDKPLPLNLNMITLFQDSNIEV